MVCGCRFTAADRLAAARDHHPGAAGQAGQAFLLNREAYREIAHSATMTAPALLISLLAQAVKSFSIEKTFDAVDIFVRFLLWFAAALFLMLAARMLRGKKDYTTTLRAAGFAQAASVLDLLAFVPTIGPLARFGAQLLALFGVWIGVSTAQEISGWRTLLLPLVYLITFVIGVVFLIAVIEGTGFAMDSLLADIGLSP